MSDCKQKAGPHTCYVCVYWNIYVYIYIYICICHFASRRHICTHSMYVCMCVCMYVCMSTCQFASRRHSRRHAMYVKWPHITCTDCTDIAARMDGRMDGGMEGWWSGGRDGGMLAGWWPDDGGMMDEWMDHVRQRFHSAGKMYLLWTLHPEP